ncbi:hypothetical protein G7085_01280 [Tessaracoccus sp. HDW20]|nr:hypothetical protein [Tessaracoccus coleopterorum]NHB83791.1 hypothetical protein [Tessaracoccus coleopterorum]
MGEDPSRVRTSVDLPEPLPPSSATASCWRTRTDTSRRIGMPPIDT